MAKKKSTTRGRKGKYHEFLVTFKELMGMAKASEVANALGKKTEAFPWHGDEHVPVT